MNVTFYDIENKFLCFYRSRDMHKRCVFLFSWGVREEFPFHRAHSRICKWYINKFITVIFYGLISTANQWIDFNTKSNNFHRSFSVHHEGTYKFPRHFILFINLCSDLCFVNLRTSKNKQQIITWYSGFNHSIAELKTQFNKNKE